MTYPNSVLKLILRTADPSKKHQEDAEFIAHSRTDCEELAKRLKRAIYIIRNIDYYQSNRLELADELESMPEEGKE